MPCQDAEFFRRGDDLFDLLGRLLSQSRVEGVEIRCGPRGAVLRIQVAAAGAVEAEPGG